MFGTDYNYLVDTEADTISGTLISYLDDSIVSVSGSISDEIDNKSNVNHSHSELGSYRYIYLTCSGTTVSGGDVIPWHDTIIKDDEFSHTTGEGVITTLSGGLYNLLYHINFENDNVDAINPAFMIKVNGTTVSATENYIYNPGSTYPYSSIDGEVMYYMSANDYFGVYSNIIQTEVVSDIELGNLAINDVSFATSISQSLTISSNSNRMVVVFASVEDGTTSTVSSITFNGTAMTSIGFIQVTSGWMNRLEAFIILESSLPSAGSYSCAVTWDDVSEALGLAIFEIYNVAQEVPEAVVTTTATATASISQNITTLTDNAWVVSGVVSGDLITFTHGTGQIEMWDAYMDDDATHAGTREEKVTAGLESVSHTASSSSVRLAMLTASFAPFSELEGPSIDLLANECSIYGELIKYT